jgi:DNA-binding XRE family transcriptional regulator
MTYDIKRWRNILGVSQEKAAELLGVHRVTYTRWENGNFAISKPVVLACESYVSHYPGNSSNKAILKARDEYEQAYKVYFNELPKGEQGFFGVVFHSESRKQKSKKTRKHCLSLF